MKKLILFTILLVFLIVGTSKAQFLNTVISVSGTTIDDISKNPVKAKIKVFNDKGKMISRTNSTGKYFVTGLKPGNLYIFDVYGTGYFYQSYEIYIPNTDKYAEISRDFSLKTMKVGVKIPIKVIPFDIGKSKIRTGADDVMDDYLNIMKFNRRASFTIVVFPENNVDEIENKKITEQRGKALLKYFSDKKIRNDIVILSNGSTDPENPMPNKKTSKGKRYKGSIYLLVNEL